MATPSVKKGIIHRPVFNFKSKEITIVCLFYAQYCSEGNVKPWKARVPGELLSEKGPFHGYRTSTTTKEHIVVINLNNLDRIGDDNAKLEASVEAGKIMASLGLKRLEIYGEEPNKVYAVPRMPNIGPPGDKTLLHYEDVAFDDDDTCWEKDGNRVDGEKRVNAEGKPVNADGELVNADGRLVNSIGQLVNAAGQCVNTDGTLVNIVEKLETSKSSGTRKRRRK